MKLVIDIDEETYNHMKERFKYGYAYTDISKVGIAVSNGTPLDKLRAELQANTEMHEDGCYYLRDEWIDEIFDKHKAESEG